MGAESSAGWWSSGEECEECGIPYCYAHSPSRREPQPAAPAGPLGTTGLDSTMFGSIEVLTLGAHTDNLLGVRSPIGNAVYRAKSYDGKPGSGAAADQIASAAQMWLCKFFDGTRRPKPDAVVAVPAKPERVGISLPIRLARAVGQALDVPVVAPLRWHPGTAQAKRLPYHDRQKALEGMLEVVAVPPAGTVLLVDDVLDTGATILVVAHALKRSGVTTVIAFAVSRTRAGERVRR